MAFKISYKISELKLCSTKLTFGTRKFTDLISKWQLKIFKIHVLFDASIPEVNRPISSNQVMYHLKTLQFFSQYVLSYTILSKNSGYFPQAHSNNWLFYIMDTKSALWEVWNAS